MIPRRRTSAPVLAAICWVAGCYASTPGEVGTVELGRPAGPAKAAPAQPGVNVPAVKVDTVGYPTAWRKVAILNVEPKGATLRDREGRVVLEIADAQIEARGLDAASRDPVWQVDFTALRRAGTYTIAVGERESDPFVVGDGVYAEALVAAQKHFYFQRTRTALVEPFARWKDHAYTREGVSHAHADVGWDLLEHPRKKKKWKVEGGWHDAGNFDMYVPSTAPTAQALLMAYEWDPARFADGTLTIPESGNGVPDLLDEVRWGLVWVLSVQQDDGAFRHREAVMEWSPEGPADHDKTVRWIAGPSTAATAKAIAVLARAARAYRGHDDAFAKRCGEAARRGWAWLAKQDGRVRAENHGAKQPLWDDEPGFTDVGARLVAAAEMWITFRDPQALELARTLFAEKEAQTDELAKGAWSNLSRWAFTALALDEKTPAEVRSVARERILAAAAAMRERVEKDDGYRCASGPADYYWASNSNLLEKAHVLLVAAKLDPQAEWAREAARDQWHWVLGRNPNGYSMVTQIGKGPTRIYHMEWGKHEPPPPGYLVGGPNAQNMGFLAPGAPAKALLWDNPKALRSGVPAHAMWHWQQSDLWDGGFVEEGQYSEGWWAVTEPDIYYNANLVLVAVAMQ